MNTVTRGVDAIEAQRRATYLEGVVWHTGAFLILNGFFWLLDAWLGEDGIQWASWITLFWGLALLFHVLAWVVDGRGLRDRAARRYRRTG